MSTDIAHPLAALIATAAKTLPRDTGATQRMRARLERPPVRLILTDVSGSMGEPAYGGRRKIDVLREAVLPLLDHCTIMAFSDQARVVAKIPEPSGRTALHLAIEAALTRDPDALLVVSDGRPDDAARALAAAARLACPIDTLYIGPETDADAVAFMVALARCGRGGGRSIVHDLRLPQHRSLGDAVALLARPS